MGRAISTRSFEDITPQQVKETFMTNIFGMMFYPGSSTLPI